MCCRAIFSQISTALNRPPAFAVMRCGKGIELSKSLLFTHHCYSYQHTITGESGVELWPSSIIINSLTKTHFCPASFYCSVSMLTLGVTVCLTVVLNTSYYHFKTSFEVHVCKWESRNNWMKNNIGRTSKQKLSVRYNNPCGFHPLVNVTQLSKINRWVINFCSVSSQLCIIILFFFSETIFCFWNSQFMCRLVCGIKSLRKCSNKKKKKEKKRTQHCF